MRVSYIRMFLADHSFCCCFATKTAAVLHPFIKHQSFELKFSRPHLCLLGKLQLIAISSGNGLKKNAFFDDTELLLKTGSVGFFVTLRCFKKWT